ncbi:hypothetical protein LZC95_48185 [Pendulispora brunnea]|uniref:DUF1800 domain-containing protein n=1 Tax=Pendulispora brunnea TaxID=2905690 RepID=A0ABZ2K693_9BACT
MLSVLACSGVAAAGCQKGTGTDESVGTSEAAAGIPVGDIRGTALVNKSLQTRLFDPQAPTTQSFAIEKLAGDDVERLRSFLGQWVTAGTQSKFQGGEPNPFGLVLWHQVIAAFAKGMGGICDTPGAVDVTFPGVSAPDASPSGATTAKLHRNVAPKIAKVCTFEGDDAAKKDAARALFHAVVDDELPEEDAAFADFFAGPDYAQAPGKKRVEAMFTALLLNPHFLLTR